MRKITLIILIVFGTFGLKAQEADTSWKISSDISLLMSQASFTNWSAGGENSLTLNGYFNFYAGYIKGRVKWENFLNLAYGQTKTGEMEFRKNEDKIDFSSSYGIRTSETSKWYYEALFNFKSQFAPGYNYPDGSDSTRVKISNFLAPAYTSIGLGMEYRPYDFMSFYLSPITARWIIVNDQDLADVGSFGVEPAYINEKGELVHGEKVKFEFGAYFRFLFVKELTKNIKFSTKLELYSNYLNNPQNIDVNWDNMFEFTINSWLAANLGWQIVYDDDTPILDSDGNTGPRTQFRQVLGVGLSYKFANR